VNNLVGNENYYLYKQDILRLAAMGVEYYSFSISWSRILPFAVAGSPVNKEGIDHYNDVINYVLEVGMMPIVTLIHFDTPVVYCGYNLTECLSRRALIGFSSGQYDNATWVEDFVNYGKIIFTHFADRVPIFYTYASLVKLIQPARTLTDMIDTTSLFSSQQAAKQWTMSSSPTHSSTTSTTMSSKAKARSLSRYASPPPDSKPHLSSPLKS